MLRLRAVSGYVSDGIEAKMTLQFSRLGPAPHFCVQMGEN